jgi:hypothetical protein
LQRQAINFVSKYFWQLEFYSDLVSIFYGSCDIIGVLEFDVEFKEDWCDFGHVEVQDVVSVQSVCGVVWDHIDFNQLVNYLCVVG